MYDFNNKTFILLENSDKGKATASTVFKYQQEEDLVTADYYGGSVRYGKIIARLIDDQLDMLYQCLTTDGELKAGKALAKISRNKENKIQLNLDWQWMEASTEQGRSEYIEQ